MRRPSKRIGEPVTDRWRVWFVKAEWLGTDAIPERCPLCERSFVAGDEITERPGPGDDDVAHLTCVLGWPLPSATDVTR